jgi:penicillin-binding protein 1A
VTVASRPAAARRSRPARLLRRLGGGVVVLCAVVAVLFGVAWVTTPGVDDARQRVDGLLAAHRATALAGALPERVVAALLATEDSRFEEHSLGVDWRGVLRAPLGLVADEDLAG